MVVNGQELYEAWVKWTESEDGRFKAHRKDTHWPVGSLSVLTIF